jgi:SAM-dependent methyltransferase
MSAHSRAGQATSISERPKLQGNILARKYTGLKRKAARLIRKLSYRAYLNAYELEVRNSHLYLPCYYFETAGSMRSNSSINKYDQIRASISQTLGERPQASVLDLGCNEGYFSLRLASEGFWVTGIDGGSNYVNVAKFLQQRFSVNGASFYELLADKETITRLPTFDVVLFLSVFQKWCFQYGFPEAGEMLSQLWDRTNRVMFFEMSDSLESEESIKGVIPYMGETKDQCRDYIIGMLRTLNSSSVAWLADYDMDYRQERRGLFAVTRVS